MSTPSARGKVYRCLVCGAELIVLGRQIGLFEPHCCNRSMVAKAGRIIFYVCPVCKAEIGVIKKGTGKFVPRCCNPNMRRIAA